MQLAHSENNFLYTPLLQVCHNKTQNVKMVLYLLFIQN